MFRKKINPILLALLLALIIGSLAYALAASNTVSTGKAGGGSAAISGYTVSNVQYALAADPSTIDTVTFDLDAAATTVKVSLVSTSSTYYNCSNTAGFSWSCSIAGAVAVADADQLEVIAVQ